MRLVIVAWDRLNLFHTLREEFAATSSIRVVLDRRVRRRRRLPEPVAEERRRAERRTRPRTDADVRRTGYATVDLGAAAAPTSLAG
jgi:hypothetical protein